MVLAPRFCCKLTYEKMSDPYKYSTPQEERINHEVKQRHRAYNSRSEELARQAEESGLNEALRKWGAHPPSAIHAAITDYFQYKDVPNQMRQMDGVEDSFRVAQVYAGMWLAAGPRLRLNILSDQVELHGQPVNEKEVPLLLRNAVGGWKFGRLPTYDEVVVYAAYNRYSPVEQYLNSLPSYYRDHRQILRNLGEQALGVSDELSLQMLTKSLVGAVARAVAPGCEQQTCLVLQGPQGVGKTTFFKALFGTEFFGHLDTSRDQRDWAMAMASRWCVELGELEAFTSKKSAGMLKNFLSSATDTYRRPYDRTPRTVPRHSVCVGSVNVGTPLVDDTGNRRYWMISVGTRIDTAWVEANRHRIWAAAKALYDEGEQWWFDYEMEKAVMERAEQYRQLHPWEEVLSELLPALQGGGGNVTNPKIREMLFAWEGNTPLTTPVLLALLGLPADKQDKRASNQLANIMRSFGWENKVVRRNGTAIREWRPGGSP